MTYQKVLMLNEGKYISSYKKVLVVSDQKMLESFPAELISEQTAINTNQLSNEEE